MHFDSEASRRLAFFALVVAVLAMLAFGVAGVGRGADVHFADLRYYFLAGTLTAQGVSPYDIAAFKAASVQHGSGARIDLFPYPPHSLAFCVALSWLPLEAARWAWTLVNGCILVGTAWAMGLRYEHRIGSPHGARPSAAALCIAAIIIGNPFAAHLIWTGQTGFMVLCCLLLAWHFDKRGRWVLAGVLLGLATIKPQLALPALAWFLLTGSWRMVGVAVATIGLLLVYAVVQIGADAVVQWLSIPGAYERQFTGSLSYNANLKSLLMGLGVPLPDAFTPMMFGLLLVGAVVLAQLHRRWPFALHDVQALLLVSALFLVQGRDYDIAVLAPLVPMLFWHARDKRWARWAGIAALLLLCVPHRGLAQSGLPLLPYYRIVVVGGLWLWALSLTLPPRAGVAARFT